MLKKAESAVEQNAPVRSRLNSPGKFATLTAIRRASSFVSTFGCSASAHFSGSSLGCWSRKTCTGRTC
jgi:hypothetical protein